MDIYSDGIQLLQEGVVLPHFRILSFFLDDILEDSFRVLDINSHGGSVRKVIDLMCPHKIDYVGVDEDKSETEKAREQNLKGTFRTMSYDRMRLRTDSYDLIVAHNQFLNDDDILERIDNLFRATRNWIILFNFLVLPECDNSMICEVDGEMQRIYGVSRLRELFGIMEPSQLEYSFIVKNDNPLKPTPSIFVVKT